MVGRDFEVHLRSVVSMLNLVCPRPPAELHSVQVQMQSSAHTVTPSRGLAGSLGQLFKSRRASSTGSNVTETAPHLASISAKEKAAESVALKESDYGPPKYNMTASAWGLVVRSRMQMDDVVDVLALDPHNLLKCPPAPQSKDERTAEVLREKLHRPRSSTLNTRK